MGTDSDILKLVCRRLEQLDIPYMVTGSFAANLYAIPRMTRDIDIVLEILPIDFDQFIKLFQHDFYIDRNEIDQARKYEKMFNIIHNETIFKVDFIVRKNSTYRHLEFQRRERIFFEGMPIWIVSPEDLIISKLEWSRDSFSNIQIRDIINIMASVNHIDLAYISDWVKKLHLEEIYTQVNSKVVNSKVGCDG
jgi:hypothetical protein